MDRSRGRLGGPVSSWTFRRRKCEHRRVKTIRTLITVREAAALASGCLRRNGFTLLLVWLLTGVSGLFLQDFLMPEPRPWRNGGMGSYLLILAVGNFLGLVGLVITARIAGKHADGSRPQELGTELITALRQVGPYLTTWIVALLRILLVILGSLPLVLLVGFLLYGAAQGTFSETVEMIMVAAPIVIFAVVGFARFGWAAYFTLLQGEPARVALGKSKAFFAYNPRTVWTLTALVLAAPILASALPYLTEQRIPELLRGASYLASLWSFGVTLLAATVITRTAEESS